MLEFLVIAYLLRYAMQWGTGFVSPLASSSSSSTSQQPSAAPAADVKQAAQAAMQQSTTHAEQTALATVLPSTVPAQLTPATATTPLAQQGSTTAQSLPSQSSAQQSLPPFPSGWEYDRPPPAEVQARASALLKQLWASGAGSTTQEQTGGRWITYQAAMTGPYKGVVAFRVKGGAPGISGDDDEDVIGWGASQYGSFGTHTHTQTAAQAAALAAANARRMQSGHYLANVVPIPGQGHQAPRFAPKHSYAAPSQQRGIQSQLNRNAAAQSATQPPAPPSPGEGDQQGQYEGDELPTVSPPAAADVAPSYDDSPDVDASMVTEQADTDEDFGA